MNGPVTELRWETLGNRELINAVAARQFGLVTRAQLIRRGVDDDAIRRAPLHLIHRGVYSTILPPLLPFQAHLAAAILRGGEGARLFGTSTAYWAGLRAQQPREIHVAVTGQKAEVPGIRWHRARPVEAVHHNRLPISPLRCLPLECAPLLRRQELRQLLAELEFRHGIRPEEVMLQRGAHGSAKLRRAIADHMPQLARTRSHLERAFLHFLDVRGLQIPLINHPVGLSTIDAVFADQCLIVELDGVRGHTGDRRIVRDHRRDLHRRREGMTVLRYAYAQLIEDGDLIEEDLRRHGVRSRHGARR